MSSAKMLRNILSLFLIAPALPVFAESPWVPEAGKVGVTTLFVHDWFQDYRRGSSPQRLPEAYKQNTVYSMFEYGLSPTVALDVSVGYTGTSYLGNGLSGMSDSLVGLRWQAYHGERTVLTVRGAAVIKGNYDLSTTANFSPGDKASGGLGSVLVGNSLPHGFFTYTEAGFRYRENPVPNDFFGNGGIGHSWRRLSWTAGYQTSRSINGLDILAPPKWKAINFPATKKIFGATDYSVNYRVTQSASVGFDYCQILHGRNAGMKKVLAFSFGYTFPGRGPHLH